MRGFSTIVSFVIEFLSDRLTASCGVFEPVWGLDRPFAVDGVDRRGGDADDSAGL